MPTVMPVSELQHNMGGFGKTRHETKEPIYLTKNGKASLVVMDAIEFDSRFAVLEGLREHGERVHRAISRGYDDMVNGRARPLDQALQDADRIRSARGGE
ncbi:type II toxin-antitoxin system Phd/YefM family antitoxin [Enorma phocaeensis]|uniref:type II toxin-antitoxin system Phd/YefM family antitoxin n=1 Tax=Enorma phocaeensis TaxID=1871019 RepID=UPI00320B2B6A